jgi:hypothetical protein
MPEYPIVKSSGEVVEHSIIEVSLTVASFGKYQLRVDSEWSLDFPYVLVCDPEIRKEGAWNYSRFHMSNGNIEFADTDVELDPYHMCLLYQLVENFEKGRKQ